MTVEKEEIGNGLEEIVGNEYEIVGREVECHEMGQAQTALMQ